MTDIKTRILHLATAMMVNDNPPCLPKVVTEEYLNRAEKDMADLEARGIQVLTYLDEEYPRQLADIPNAPRILYVKSVTPVEELFPEKMIAVVGTRDASPYGLNTAWNFVCEVPGKSPIVSGLALGVDIKAHNAALTVGRPTIAVLPCGLDTVYPFAHRQIAGIIATTRGCALVSPYPPGTAPEAFRFLDRNRVIAGLCDSTVVVESKAKGGALVTAKLAKDYGRKVFAFTGRIDDVRSAGCNALIAEGTARILTRELYNQV